MYTNTRPSLCNPGIAKLLLVIRRAIAQLLLLAFCCFTLEVGVADVHDGDASAEEIAQLAGGVVNVPANDGPTDVPQQEQGSGHIHACHCTHAHGTLNPAGGVAAEEFANSRRPHRFLALIPDVVALDVQVRPPIA